jgi:hypothetical protein
MRMKHIASAVAVLVAAMICGADAIADQAGTNLPEQSTYQTKGVVLDARDMARWASASYWEQKVGGTFELAVDPRMQADAEERDAVLATVWRVKPKEVNAEVRIVAVIPKRSAKPRAMDIAYQIVFSPRSSARDKDRVETRFISEGPGSRPIVAPAPATGAFPRLPSTYTYAGFPQNNNIGRYSAEHAGEMKSILTWIAIANPAFDQILTTNVVEGTAVRSACFLVTGTKAASGSITSLRIVFLGDTVPVISELPAGYNARDVADFQIEMLQAESRGQDKLGAITGIAELPSDERLPAKYAVWQYFSNRTRDAEIDAIVPVPNSEKRALLTVRFGANNNVGVQRIGEDRKNLSLGRLGDVRHVNGFGANSADVPALMAWLKKRYPGVTPRGTTVTELQNSLTAEIQTRSGTPAWFKENYGIEVLAASAAQSQLTRLFQYSPQQLVGLQDFTPSELQMLEVTLEKMSDRLVSRFKGLQMARQKISVELIGVSSTKFAINKRLEAGVALLRSNDRMIVIFDSMSLNSEALFVGGSGAGGLPAVVAETFWVFAHEFGHVVAAMPGMKESFDGLVRAKASKPVTWYAAANPKDEFFPEAFALYLGDPEWLSGNRPDLFNWFETLSR